MTPLAHVGHWLVDLIYVAPLAVVALFALAGRVRAHRRERQEGNPPAR